jgi:transcriptional regulator with XRE-family HTH domain
MRAAVPSSASTGGIFGQCVDWSARSADCILISSMKSTLARRIFLAHLELSYRLGRKVTLAEFGELVARQMKRSTPFSAAAVSRWEAGTKIPGGDVIEAIAAVTHTDPGWISHGDRSAAPAPPRTGEAEAAEPLIAEELSDREESEQSLPPEPGKLRPKRATE